MTTPKETAATYNFRPFLTFDLVPNGIITFNTSHVAAILEIDDDTYIQIGNRMHHISPDQNIDMLHWWLDSIGNTCELRFEDEVQ